MSSNLLTINPGCDLVRLERTNMVTKMEDRVKVDLVAMSKLILDHLRLCDPASLAHTPEMLTGSLSSSIKGLYCSTSMAKLRERKRSAMDKSSFSRASALTHRTGQYVLRTWWRLI